VGEVPALYEFFQKQPKDILIALAEEANNLPTFSNVDFGRQEICNSYQVATIVNFVNGQLI